MKKALFSLLFLPITLSLNAQMDTLGIERVRELATQNSPLQQKKNNAQSIRDAQLQNLHSNNLPRIQAGAQATWQSDVFGLPIESPLFKIPTVPKDQYKVTLDVAERIWDGNSDRYLRQQRELESELAAAQVDVDAFSLREIVTDLYFKTLLLQENEAILAAARKDLDTRKKQAEAAVNEGVSLRTSVDQIQIQILKTDQQIAATQSDRDALLAVLAQWIGRDNSRFALQLPEEKTSTVTTAKRPEYELFQLQQRSLEVGKSALSLRKQPRLEAFAQGGLGRPNPFNFFETDFQPFLLLGLRAVWTPIDWGNKRRDAQVFDLQMKNIDIQRSFFDQRLEANTLKDRQDEAKWQAQMAQDDAIIALQSDIIRRADAQVKNGVMTMTDYLAQLNLLTQSQLNKKMHEVQKAQAREMQRARGFDQ